ncbi:TPA: chromosome partitioning protein ParB [Patescibacteria group bacterium]|nr:MAG: ParB-like protein [Parcubacteria group bacterium GW2011_GWA2_46_39]HBV33374.1 chromosome partitioning protein ParB [Patescibacteria group bacterium]HCU47635.1 chromosome partitioning protein ParB [Patescibacteria group bacterium]
MANKQFQLGKGLSALIPKRVEPSAAAPIMPAPSEKNQQSVIGGEQIVQLSVDKIKVNPYQPRQLFDQSNLDELAASIKVHGILQPLVVSPEEDYWQLIAGERRLQAAKKAGLTTVPVIIRASDQQQRLELSLVENIQRQNLNPIEEALAFKRLHDEFSLTQEQIALRVGKSRSQVANTIRLLELPLSIQEALKVGTITLGHAKVIMSLDNKAEQEKFFKAVLLHGLSVKETSLGVKRLQSKGKAPIDLLPFKDLANELRQVLGTKVNIVPHGNAIKVEIEYYSPEELRSLLERLR